MTLLALRLLLVALTVLGLAWALWTLASGWRSGRPRESGRPKPD